MIQNSKLSNRFIKKDNEQTVQSDNFEKVEIVEPDINIDKEISPEDLKETLLAKIASIPIWHEFSSEKQKEMIKTFLTAKNDNYTDIDLICNEILNSTNGFGPIEKLINNEKITAIFLNETNPVYIEIDGKILNTEIKLTEIDFYLIKNYLFDGKNIDDEIFTLNKENLNISVIKGEKLNITIRRNITANVYYLIEKGFITKETHDFLVSAIKEKKNIVICGSVNAGKSTLLESLINSCSKRSVLLEQDVKIKNTAQDIIKFKYTDEDLIENVIKLMPEYIFNDLNKPVPQLTDFNGVLMTVRAPSVESAVKKLVSSNIYYENLTEKFARTKVLTHIDYIVFVNGFCVKSIIELTPAKTAAASMRIIM